MSLGVSREIRVAIQNQDLGAEMLSSMMGDVRFALRSLTRRPAFSACVVIALAMGIGANTAVYSVVDRVLFHPLEIERSDQTVAIFEETKTSRFERTAMSTYLAIASQSTAFENLAAESYASIPFFDAGHERELNATFVTNNYFDALRIRPQLGRLTSASDPGAAGSNNVVVLSDQFWKNQFGADAQILGKALSIAGQQLTVIGVAPARFRGVQLSETPSVWIPMSAVPTLNLGGLSQIKFLRRTESRASARCRWPTEDRKHRRAREPGGAAHCAINQ